MEFSEFQGVIVRRNCFGRKLSFADIREARDDDDKNSGNSDDNASIVKLTFRRASSNWNEEESPRAFPIKKTDLPYGGLVWVKVVPYKGPSSSTTTNPQSEATPPTTTTNNSETAAPEKEEAVIYEVVCWKLLKDPKENAEALASIVPADATATTSSPQQPKEEEVTTDTKEPQSNTAMGGILYSTYLRERGNHFVGTIKAKKQQEQKLLDNSSGTNKSKKRPRSNNAATASTNSTQTNDDLTTTEGGHGNRVAKAQRAKIFAQFVLETFGKDLLQKGSGVLDVAGGRGGVTMELAVQGHVPCTMIDPMVRNRNQPLSELQTCPAKFPNKRNAKRIRKAGGPLPRHLATWFNQTDFLQRHGCRRPMKTNDISSNNGDGVSNGNDATAAGTGGAATIIDITNGDDANKGVSEDINHNTGAQYNNGKHLDDASDNNTHNNDDNNHTSDTDGNGKDDDGDNDDRYLIDDCSCLVGLHPDQITQDILDVALAYHKNVAIVPCCVFPTFFPMRLLCDGTPVVTHAQFCQYLLEQDESLQQAMLPFQGRNIVIYRRIS